jgi:hypothetical protein
MVGLVVGVGLAAGGDGVLVAITVGAVVDCAVAVDVVVIVAVIHDGDVDLSAATGADTGADPAAAGGGVFAAMAVAAGVDMAVARASRKLTHATRINNPSAAPAASRRWRRIPCSDGRSIAISSAVERTTTQDREKQAQCHPICDEIRVVLNEILTVRQPIEPAPRHAHNKAR